MVPMIEVFADVSCPFAYVQLHQLASRRTLLGKDRHMRIRAWPLELVNGGPTDAGKIADEVAALRAQVDSSLFAGFDPQRLPSTTLPALDLAGLAYRHSDEVGEQVSLALRTALFLDGRDVSDAAVLGDIAAEFGLGSPGPSQRDDVLQDWTVGQTRDVEGSPHFFCADRNVFSPGLAISDSNGVMIVTLTVDVLDAFIASCTSDH